MTFTFSLGAISSRAMLVNSLALFVLANTAVALEPPHEKTRAIKFTYKTEVEAVPEGTGPVDIFIPLAHSDGNQEVVQREITASIPGKIKTEATYGNEFWHGHLDTSDGKPVTISVAYEILRKTYKPEITTENVGTKYSPEELAKVERFLAADALVPVSGELVEKVLKDIPKTADAPIAKARAIYDYVVQTMEYKKEGTGWGNGDFHWACSERYGNCTDFHSLFIGLARAEKIPAKFEIGFSIPEDKPEAEIKGYHCWAEFFVPKAGWIPIDASEAKKNPEKKELLFGEQPTDRIQFTVGRDIKLGDGHTGKPLNYFIYPYVEVGGAKYDKLKNSFSFRSGDAPEAERKDLNLQS